MVECQLLLVQPSRLSREGLRRILHDTAGSIHDVSSVQTYLKSEHLVRPDAVIWGTGIPVKVLCAEIAATRARFGHMPSPVKHIIIAHELGGNFIRQILALDVEALLHDDITGEVLLRSLELVMLGQRLFPVLHRREQSKMQAEVVPFPGALSKVEAPMMLPQLGRVTLSSRESEILRHLVDGASNKAIAHELQITEATVKVHVRALLRKIRATNRTQAATWALHNKYGIANDASRPLQVADG